MACKLGMTSAAFTSTWHAVQVQTLEDENELSLLLTGLNCSTLPLKGPRGVTRREQPHNLRRNCNAKPRQTTLLAAAVPPYRAGGAAHPISKPAWRTHLGWGSSTSRGKETLRAHTPCPWLTSGQQVMNDPGAGSITTSPLVAWCCCLHLPPFLLLPTAQVGTSWHSLRCACLVLISSQLVIYPLI